MQTRANDIGMAKLRIVKHKQRICNFNNACQTKQKGEFVTKEFKITFLNKKRDEWIVLQPKEADTQKALLRQYERRVGWARYLNGHIIKFISVSISV